MGSELLRAPGGGTPVSASTLAFTSPRLSDGSATTLTDAPSVDCIAAGSATLTASAPGLGAGTTLRITYE